MNSYYFGVDPGSQGAIALLSWDRRCLAMKDLPRNKVSREFDYFKFLEILESFLAVAQKDSKGENFKIYLSSEDPSINALFSKKSLFAFGKSISGVIGCLTAFMKYNSEFVHQEVFLYRPRLWQGHCLAKGEKTSKEKSVEFALMVVGPNELLPLTLHQGQRGDRAEAILIANYCRAIVAEEVVKIPNKRNPKKTARKKPSTRKTTKMKRV